MNKILLVHKPIAMTPLEALHRVKTQYPEHASDTLGYAGRLDPMAEGLLLVLVNDENQNRKVYEGLHKEYEVDVLFGVSTDTYDGMGIASEVVDPSVVNITAVAQFASTMIGEHMQAYPPYSSARVQGKPLYYYARRGLIHTIDIPQALRIIQSLTHLGSSVLTHEELWDRLHRSISRVNGDFRQSEILDRWRHVLAAPYTFPICTFKIACSSGTYMRSIAHELGKMAHTGAFALSIRRTRIGEWDADDALRITADDSDDA